MIDYNEVYMSSINQVHSCQLQILKDVTRVCDDNKIDYMLACGSLIGAIRHHGFIPWDDDIDIYMTTENYKKFLKIGQKCLGDNYFIQNWRSEKEFSDLWTQVRLNNTTSMPKKLINWDIHFGIHIDVFPVVGIPNESELAKRQNIYITISKSLLAADYMRATGQKPMGKQKYINFLPRFLRRFIVSLLEKQYLISPKSTEKCAELWISLRKPLKSEWFYSFINVEFEDNYFKTTKYYDDYLSLVYGDYMTPPPETERAEHAVLGEIIKDVNKDYKVYKKYIVKN